MKVTLIDPVKRSFFLFFVLCLFFAPAFGQQLEVVNEDRLDPANDTVLVTAKGMPRIIPLAGLDSLPFYTYTFIFGDGSFTSGRDSIAEYLYNAPKLAELGLLAAGAGIDEAYPTVSLYFVDSYGGGQEPPGLTIPQDTTLEKDDLPSVISRPPASVSRAITLNRFYDDNLPEQSVVDTGFIRMQANTDDIRPGDTIVFILSFKNQLPDLAIPFGNIHLFYNSEIDKRSGLESRKVVPDATPPAPEYGRFHFRKDMIYFANLDTANQSLAPKTPHFQDVRTYRYFEMFPQEERRVFIEFAVDTLMWEYIQGREKGRVSFFAVMTAGYSQQPPFSPDLLDIDDTAQELLDSFNTDGFLKDVSQTQGANFQVLAAEYITFDLVKSHDPNRMTIETCQCPGEGRNTLLCSVEFSNDGDLYTQEVLVDVAIPEALDFGTLEVLEYPEVLDQFATSQFLIEPDNSDRRYRFRMTNYALLSTKEYGAGHPRTQGKIVFTINTRVNAGPEDVPPMSACITFDNNFEETFCTPAVQPLLTVAANDENARMLNCNACPDAVEPPFPGGEILCDWICKLILLLVALLLIILVIYLRWKKNN